MGNPRRVRRHRRTYHKRTYRRNPSFRVGGKSVINILSQGLVAGAGAGLSIFMTNMLSKLLGKTGKGLSAQQKNWAMLGMAVVMSYALPKLKLGKYADAAVTGALAVSFINIASTSFGMGGMLSLSGESNPELDKIIANLNISGEDDDLLGLTESGGLLGLDEDTDLLGANISLMGLTEGMSGEDEGDDY